MTLRSLAVAAPLLVAFGTAARADITLHTTVAQAGTGASIICNALNSGKKTADLTVQVINLAGAAIQTTTCTRPPGEACTVGNVGPLVAHCRLISTGGKKDLRGALLLIDPAGNSILSIEAR